MEPLVQVTEEVAFGPQPAAADLARLAEQGFAAVISMRHDGEEQDPIALPDDKAAAEKAGLLWTNFPVSMRTARDETVDRFRRELSRVKKPVFVYDRTGNRAGAFIIMDLAVRRQMSAEQALARARELNVQLSDERLVELIRKYVDSRRTVQA
jgi:uncharacterized protein (TIGR01244 family)